MQSKLLHSAAAVKQFKRRNVEVSQSLDKNIRCNAPDSQTFFLGLFALFNSYLQHALYFNEARNGTGNHFGVFHAFVRGLAISVIFTSFDPLLLS